MIWRWLLTICAIALITIVNIPVALAQPAPTDISEAQFQLGEGLGQWEQAIADYRHLLSIDPQDAMAYNNLGNAYAGLNQWDRAIKYYQKATKLDPNFAFARANYALALYQTGETGTAIQNMKNIVRKYRDFPDMRAALSAALWVDGKRGEAESNWVAVVGLDSRYKSIDWVKNNRRWPPNMVLALEKFLKLQ